MNPPLWVSLRLGLSTDLGRKILIPFDLSQAAKGIALAAGIPNELAPIIKVSETESVESVYNDPDLTMRLAAVFKKTLGPENVVELPPKMTSEDFGLFGLDGHRIPVCQYPLGALDPAKVESSKKTGIPLPSTHSPLFAPLPEHAIRTGIKTMTSAVLELMKK